MVVSSLPPPHILSKFVYLFALSSSLLKVESTGSKLGAEPSLHSASQGEASVNAHL
jgi:hypothetical protein